MAGATCASRPVTRHRLLSAERGPVRGQLLRPVRKVLPRCSPGERHSRTLLPDSGRKPGPVQQQHGPRRCMVLPSGLEVLPRDSCQVLRRVPSGAHPPAMTSAARRVRSAIARSAAARAHRVLSFAARSVARRRGSGSAFRRRSAAGKTASVVESPTRAGGSTPAARRTSGATTS